MANIVYVFYVRDNTALQAGSRKTGLTPTWVHLKKLSDNSNITPQPAITEIGQGQYKLTYDPEANGDAAGQIDAGSGLSNPSDRYIDLLLTKEAGTLLQSQYVAPVIEGTVSSESPTTTTFTLTGSTLSSTDDLYSDARMYVLFTSGVNKGLRKQITGYVGGSRQVTCKAFPSAPAEGDTCWIVA